MRQCIDKAKPYARSVGVAHWPCGATLNRSKMAPIISQRLLEIVEALPLTHGLRVLEIGCGTGVAAREIAKRIGNGNVLAIDRSAKAIEQAIRSSQTEINKGTLRFLQAKIETFELP